MTTNTCPRTGTRRAACLCSVCAIDKSPERKHAANKRDVLELLGMLNTAVQHHPELIEGPITWAKAGTLANLRQQLRDVAVGLSLSPGGSEEDAIARVEAALCSDDGDVGMALIDAL